MATNEIKNELELDVSNFTAGLEKATQELTQLSKKFDNVGAKTDKLEKDFKDLSSNVGQAGERINTAASSINGLAGSLERAKSTVQKASATSSKLKNDLGAVSQEARKSEQAMSSASEWVGFYGASLDKLRPKIDALKQTQANASKVTSETTKTEFNAIQKGIESKAKALEKERKIAEDQIAIRKQMLAQLDTLQKRAEIKQAVANDAAYKTNASGQTVRRNFGKNAYKHNALVADIESFKAELRLIEQQRSNIKAIVGELSVRTREIQNAVERENQLHSTNQKTLSDIKAQAKAVSEANQLRAKGEKEAALIAKEAARQAKIDQKEAIALFRESEKRRKQSEKEALDAEKEIARQKKLNDKELLRQKKASDKAAADAEKATIKENNRLAREALKEKTRLESEARREEKRLASENLKAEREAIRENARIKREADRQARQEASSASKEAIRLEREAKREEKRIASENYRAERQAIRESTRLKRQADLENNRIKRQAERETERAARLEATTALKEKLRLEREAKREEKRLASENYRAERDAVRENARIKREADRENARLAREEIRRNKQLHAENLESAKIGAGIGAGLIAGRVASEGTNEINQFQIAQARVKGILGDNDEYREFIQKASDTTKTRPYLSQTESIHTREDALTALGHNDVGIIDKTVGKASDVGYLLRRLGYETDTQSSVVRNLYGLIEARQVQGSAEKSNQTMEMSRRIIQGSGGKIQMNDLETVARNIGDLRATMTDQGWYHTAAMMEQFKAAGSNGGSGSATVGNILKMISLYASGKPMTNMGASQLFGADQLNDVQGMFKDGRVVSSKEGKEFQKALKFSGFKSAEQLAADPIAAIAGMRKNLMSYMSTEKNYKTYYGPNAERPIYNDKGRMVKKDGTLVAEDEQGQMESVALKKFASRSGWSNRAIDAFLTALNTKFIERVEHASKLMQGSQSTEQQIGNLENNWGTSIANLQTSLKNLVVEFSPLLEKLTAIPDALTGIVNAITGASRDNPILAQLAALVLGFGALRLASAPAILVLSRLSGVLKIAEVGGAVQKVTLLSRLFAILGLTAKASAVSVGAASASIAGSTAAAGAASAGAAAASRVGFGAMIAGAWGAAKGVGGAVGGIFRVVGLLTNWAGWLILAAMFGWVVGRWISDLKVGGLTVGEHVQNMMNGVHSTFERTINSISMFWNQLITRLSGDTAKLKAERDQLIAEGKSIDETEKLLRIQAPKAPDTEASLKNDAYHAYKLSARNSKDERDIQWSGKYSLWEGHKRGLNTGQTNVPGIPRDTVAGKEFYAQFNSAKGKIAKAEKAKANEAAAKAKSEADAKAHKSLVELGGNSNFKPAEMPTVKETGKKSGGKREEIAERDPGDKYFYEELGVKNLTLNQTLAALRGEAPDLQKQALEIFKQKWLGGEFDVNRDQKRRMFVKSGMKYDAKKGWDLNALDMNGKTGSGVTVQQIIDRSAETQAKTAQKDAETFANGNVGERDSDFGDKLARLTQAIEEDAKRKEAEADSPTPTKLLDRLEQFVGGNDRATIYKRPVDLSDTEFFKTQAKYGKYEAKNPLAPMTSDDRNADGTANRFSYNNTKLIDQAMAVGTDAMDSFEAMNRSISDATKASSLNSIADTRKEVDAKIDGEKRKHAAVVDSLKNQLDAMKANGLENEKVYQDLQVTYKSVQDKMTEYNKASEKQRLVETRSSADANVAAWRDIQKSTQDTLAEFGSKAVDDLWDIGTGSKKFDLAGFGKDLLSGLGKNAFKFSMGSISNAVLGEGEGTSMSDYAKALFIHQDTSNSNMLGRSLNAMRGRSIGDKANGNGDGFMGMLKGILGIGGTPQGAESTDPQSQNTTAVSNNTDALNRLTQAMGGQTPFLATGGATANPMSFAGAVLGPQNVPAIDFNSGVGALSSLGVGSVGSPYTTALGSDFGSTAGMAETFGESNGTGMFASIKNGFSALFSSKDGGGLMSEISTNFSTLFSSDGGVLSSVSDGFSGLFSSGSTMMGGITTTLGGAFSTVANSLVGALSSMGGSAGKVGSWIGLAANVGMAYWGASAGGGAAPVTASAKGNAFGAGGLVHAFASGGAFTNGLYDSPTMFKFANGGSFGVMGEAGPEAVMPLSRDSSGRLGVSLHSNGQSSEDTSNEASNTSSPVSISITVTNNGSQNGESGSTTSDDQSNWNKVAVRVKTIVQDEIVRQQKPGGALYNK